VDSESKCRAEFDAGIGWRGLVPSCWRRTAIEGARPNQRHDRDREDGMIDTAYCLTMAQHGSWMNRKLFDLCATLPDDVRKRDLHAFFRSIHGTLDHILAIDMMFMAHFKEGAPTYLPEGEHWSEFRELRGRREAVDAEIMAWSGGLSAAWLAESSVLAHHGDGLPRHVTRGFWVVQMFNHQTHHRGQVATLLTQLGQDIGSTDLHMSVPYAGPETRG
jgi:uncharacterized damage-inducible protein DinB